MICQEIKIKKEVGLTGFEPAIYWFILGLRIISINLEPVALPDYATDPFFDNNSSIIIDDVTLLLKL